MLAMLEELDITVASCIYGTEVNKIHKPNKTRVNINHAFMRHFAAESLSFIIRAITVLSFEKAGTWYRL